MKDNDFFGLLTMGTKEDDIMLEEKSSNALAKKTFLSQQLRKQVNFGN